MTKPHFDLCHRSGKVMFPNRREANNARVRWRQQRGHMRHRTPEHVYLCPHCDHYHLTKVFKKARR